MTVSNGIGAKRLTWRREWPEMDRTCANCGRPGAELAHVAGREHDFNPSLKQVADDTYVDAPLSVLYVCETRVLPLCGPATSSDTCHGRYDAHRLDILPLLDRARQIQAVADLGLERAYRTLTGERRNTNERKR